MEDKKFKFLGIYLAVVVLLVIFIKLSNGPSSLILLFVFMKYLLLIFCCTLPISLVFLKKYVQKKRDKKIEEKQFFMEENDEIKESEVKKNPFEYTPPANNHSIDWDFSTVISFIISGVLASFMLVGIWHCVLDMIEGPEQIVLTDAAYTKNVSTTGRGSRRHTTVFYELEGVSIDGNGYHFRINGLNDELASTINKQNPSIVCYMYPHSNALKQVDIYTNEGIITLPKGKEPRLNPETGQTYVASELENVHKFEELDFKNYIDITDEMSDFMGQPVYSALDEFFYAYDMDDVEYGFHIKDSNDENYSLYKSITEAIKEEKEISGNSECKVLYKDDIAIVFVYNINTDRVSNIYALRCLSLSDK